MLCFTEGAQQHRHKLGQPLARLDGLGGPVTAVMPGPYGAGDHFRAIEAELLQRIERVGIIALAGKDQIAGLRREIGFLFE